jgi:hypothetical protein
VAMIWVDYAWTLCVLNYAWTPNFVCVCLELCDAMQV